MPEPIRDAVVEGKLLGRLAGGHAASRRQSRHSRSAAVEGAAHNIRANPIIVGFIVDSGGHEPILDDPAGLASLRSMYLTRLGRTDDIANAALYLASDEAGFVNGISLPVDGGSNARLAVVGS